tara:strand:+ start:451 stop:1359 length:909 start_codon:yes stop_codon:yes gene_type:complete
MKKIKNTEIVDTFAEAFEMWASRLIVTAESEEWALAAAKSATGFATSVIGCKCEAGIEKLLKQEETPDNRYGVSILIFTMDPKSLEKRLTERIGQSIMTCPTTACFNGLDSKDSVNVGGQLKYFGDGYQIRKSLLGRRFWRIPVMDGEFIVDEKFNIQPAVGGGNIILLAKDQESALVSAQAAVKAMQSLPNIILPFPNGVVRSGSKVGSKKYKTLPASTNHSFCPTLKGFVNDSNLPDEANATLEIVIDGLDLESVEKAMLVGIQAASGENILQISAGNYGGGLGKYKINLNEVLAKQGEE